MIILRLQLVDLISEKVEKVEKNYSLTWYCCCWWQWRGDNQLLLCFMIILMIWWLVEQQIQWLGHRDKNRNWIESKLNQTKSKPQKQQKQCSNSI